MKEELLKEIGYRLQLIRNKLGLLQKDFAEALDISGSSISEMESGNAKPRFELIYNINREFNVNINYLLHGKGPMLIPGGIYALEDIELGEESMAALQELIKYFSRSQLIRTAVINHFRKYMLEERDLIEKDIQLIQSEKKLKEKEKTSNKKEDK